MRELRCVQDLSNVISKDLNLQNQEIISVPRLIVEEQKRVFEVYTSLKILSMLLSSLCTGNSTKSFKEND